MQLLKKHIWKILFTSCLSRLRFIHLDFFQFLLCLDWKYQKYEQFSNQSNCKYFTSFTCQNTSKKLDANMLLIKISQLLQKDEEKVKLLRCCSWILWYIMLKNGQKFCSVNEECMTIFQHYSWKRLTLNVQILYSWSYLTDIWEICWN